MIPLPTAQRASQTYREALGPSFEASAVGYAAGQVLAAAGWSAIALATWLAALDEPSAQAWPYLMNALLALALQTDRSQEVATELGSRATRLVDLSLWQGRLLRLAGAPEQALAPLALAMARCTGNVRYTATTERLRALISLGRLDEALAVCDAAGQVQPAYAAHLAVSRAGILAAQGQNGPALALLESVIAGAPTLAEAHLNRGSLLLRLGRRQEGLAALETALRLNPFLAGDAQRILEQAP